MDIARMFAIAWVAVAAIEKDWDRIKALFDED